MNIEERVKRLERHVQYWQATAVACGLVTGAVLMLGATRAEPIIDLIKVKKLELYDPEGTAVIAILESKDKRPQLRFIEKERTTLQMGNAHDQRQGFVVFDVATNQIGSRQISSGVELYDPSMSGELPRGSFSMVKGESYMPLLFMQGNNCHVIVEAADYGRASVQIAARTGPNLMQIVGGGMSATKDQMRFEFNDRANKKQRVAVLADQKNATLTLFDAEGKPKVELGTQDKGKDGDSMTLPDASGKPPEGD